MRCVDKLSSKGVSSVEIKKRMYIDCEDMGHLANYLLCTWHISL